MNSRAIFLIVLQPVSMHAVLVCRTLNADIRFGSNTIV